jgi:protein associated with RNAse G/E
MDNQITIQALKYGNLLHYEWNTTLLEKTDSHIFVLGQRGRQLHHYTKQKVFTMETWTIEFFSFDSWFTVSADIVHGEIKQYYCNINQPAKMDGHTVSFVDLDLDYIRINGEWMVVDEDEFESNAIKFAYPDTLIHQARQELEDLKERVRNNLFPFDGSLAKHIASVPSE